MKKMHGWGAAAILLCIVFSYGGIRLWFHYTDGFRLSHITSDLVPDPRWKARDLDFNEEIELDKALSQNFSYIGKGCQSYAFVSDDGRYVLKFLKYKRLRPQFYFYWFTFIPEFKEYLNHKIVLKKMRMRKLFASWMIAFDYLPKETALLYIHLNKTDNLKKTVTIRDYAGYTYNLQMDDMEFLIQKRGGMLCSEIDRMMVEGKERETKKMLSGLFQMIISEYSKGFADADHALMQNTGVINEKAFQLDVGRFIVNPIASRPDYYHQELFNKYYKFRLWLKKYHPSLFEHVDHELREEIGESFHTIQYIPSY